MNGPTKTDRIKGNLLAMQGWAKRGEDVVSEEAKLKEVVLMLMKISNELWIHFCTDEKQGCKWGWWE